MQNETLTKIFLKPLDKLDINTLFTHFELGNRPILGLCPGRFPNWINWIRFFFSKLQKLDKTQVKDVFNKCTKCTCFGGVCHEQ